MWPVRPHRASVPSIWYRRWYELCVPGTPSGQAQHFYSTARHLFQVSRTKSLCEVRPDHLRPVTRRSCYQRDCLATSTGFEPLAPSKGRICYKCHQEGHVSTRPIYCLRRLTRRSRLRETVLPSDLIVFKPDLTSPSMRTDFSVTLYNIN
jgi:hypothetical protein